MTLTPANSMKLNPPKTLTQAQTSKLTPPTPPTQAMIDRAKFVDRTYRWVSK